MQIATGQFSASLDEQVDARVLRRAFRAHGRFPWGARSIYVRMPGPLGVGRLAVLLCMR